MAASIRKFQFLLLLLFVLQVMMAMVGEASLCESPSKLFKGACFRSSNCATICEKEGFLNGRCKFFKCICSKDCNSGGGGGGPPGEGPPDGGNGPPGEDPPEGPPDGGNGPPGEDPPEGPPDGGDGDSPTPSASHQKKKDAFVYVN